MQLYIHIPFCDSKCLYCKFASIGQIDYEKVDTYVKKIITDIKKHNTGSKSVLLKSIYFWWWTPSILTKSHFEDIFNAINWVFQINENTEITLETTPQRATRENISMWESFPFNRISMWVESLNPKTLEITRRWKVEDIYKALDNLELSKYENISLDFIIGLPYVAKKEIWNNIESLVLKYKKIKHISFYMLEAGDYPKIWKSLSIKEDDYEDEYIFTKNLVQKLGFERYEISNFAKLWYKSIHNSWYWDHSNYIWIWVWAHWFENNTRYAWVIDFNWFYEGKYDYIEAISEHDLALEKVMFWLRTSGVDKKYLHILDGEIMQEFIDEWYLFYDKNKLCLTDKWVLVMDFLLEEMV